MTTIGIFTAGTLANTYIPDAREDLRVAGADALLARFPQAKVIITGGYKNYAGIGLADITLTNIWEFRPHMLPSIAVVNNEANGTVADIIAAVRELGFSPSEQEFWCPTHRKHYDRIAPTITRLGFQPRFHDSGEDDSAYGKMDEIGKWITGRDPLWRGPLGWACRGYNCYSAYKHYDVSDKFARENPELAAEWVEKVSKALVTWRKIRSQQSL